MITHKYFNSISQADLYKQSEKFQLNKLCSDIINLADSGAEYYKVFSLIELNRIDERLVPFSNKIKDNFSDVIIIGMGGASLNPKCALNTILTTKSLNRSNINIHFLDNTDPIFFDFLLNSIDYKKTAIIAISNSGNTLETNSLVLALIKVLENNGVEDFSDRLFAITSNKKSTLFYIVDYFGGSFIQHEKNINGRYSGLSTVSIFPLMLAGLDYGDYIAGANTALKNFRDRKQDSMSVTYALNILSSKKNIIINTGYLQNYKSFLDWYRQIIAESLGKFANSYTPVTGIAPADQHSMFQLYLGGSDDKFHNVYYIKADSILHKHYHYEFSKNFISNYNSAKVAVSQSKSFDHKTDLFAINDINYVAATKALIKKNIPLRLIELQDLSENSIGELVAETMLESVILGRLVGINPFDQPAVELIKSESSKLVDLKDFLRV